MNARVSLRARLTVIILFPLLLISIGVAIWAARDAQTRAADRFDRSLLVTALGISRDTAFSGGDALSRETRDLLRDTSGGQVFYHVYAPDGVFVTGYATPPVPPEHARRDGERFTFFDAEYQDVAVRVIQFRDHMSIDGLSGDFTFTVWQNLSLRDGFVQSLSQRTYVVMATLVIAVALIVWFGVRFGLRPLLDLEEAIERRSSEDLTAIRRSIPSEVRGIVGRLNILLKELSGTLKAKDDFISDAAHQLRNPIAGVLALSEAVVNAPTFDESKRRSADLFEATRTAARLTDDLLAFERAKSPQPSDQLAPIDLSEVLLSMSPDLTNRATAKGVDLSVLVPEGGAIAKVDRTLFGQAVINLVENSLEHGGAELTEILVLLTLTDDVIDIAVRDNGIGIRESEFPLALARFSQVTPSDGSGLGLPIAMAVAEGAGGHLVLSSEGQGLTAKMSIPSCADNLREQSLNA